MVKREIAAQEVAAASGFSHEAYAIEAQEIGEGSAQSKPQKRAEPKFCPFAEAGCGLLLGRLDVAIGTEANRVAHRNVVEATG
jgi:hypothetical protein